MSSFIDLIIRIRNGYMAKKVIIESPHSKFKEEILKKLKSLNLIKNFKVSTDKVKKIEIELLYIDGQPAISSVKIFSSPGRRWYINAKSLRSLRGGFSWAILSTPKGILTNLEAKKENVGGELLFEVW